MSRYLLARFSESHKVLFLNGMKKNKIILFGVMEKSLPCTDQITAVRPWS